MSSQKKRTSSQWLSRREFLRISGLGLPAVLGLYLPPQKFIFPSKNNKFSRDTTDFEIQISQISSTRLLPNQQGRVINDFVDVYDIPSFNGSLIKRFWQDRVLPITDISIGKTEDSFNMVWYKLGDEGYANSGEIQPVLTIKNSAVQNLPKNGAVAEVTVPYTDGRLAPGMKEQVTYRFYYSTTCWVLESLTDDQGKSWYGVHDDKWNNVLYVPAEHLRLIPYEELKPLSPNVPANKKRIEVHLPEQVMIAYEYDQPVYMARVATGAIFSNGDYSTPPGTYTTFHKRPSRHMARGNLAANSYDLPGVPWNSYITEEGIAFHGTYWHNNFGRPRSHGCINLTSQAARWVYLWTSPIVPPYEEWVYKKTGTIVDIID